MSFYGKSYSQVDKKLIKGLRSWVADLFSRKVAIDQSHGVVKLSDLDVQHKTGYHDFDLIVKVLKITALDDKMSYITVSDDSDQIWVSHIYTSKYRWLRVS